jgi:hypothetical protein
VVRVAGLARGEDSSLGEEVERVRVAVAELLGVKGQA